MSTNARATLARAPLETGRNMCTPKYLMPRTPCTAGAMGDIINRPRAGRPLSSSPMPARLSDLDTQRALGSLPGWARRGNVLTKTFTWPSFAAGIDIVTRIAKAADAVDHHQDIDIRYTKITCGLSPPDAGEIPDADLALAATIETLSEV